MLRLFVVMIVAGATMAQVPFLGRCPNVETVSDFNVEKYAGRWYEVERYFMIFEFGGKCVTADYSLNSNGTLEVVNEQISAIMWILETSIKDLPFHIHSTGIASSIKGLARFAGKSTDAKLLVVFPSLPLPVDAPYWILDTDYESYSVVYSCTHLGIVSLKFAWILTREPSPPVSVLEKAYQAIDKNGISRAYFIRTDQKNCPPRK